MFSRAGVPARRMNELVPPASLQTQACGHWVAQVTSPRIACRLCVVSLPACERDIVWLTMIAGRVKGEWWFRPGKVISRWSAVEKRIKCSVLCVAACAATERGGVTQQSDVRKNCRVECLSVTRKRARRLNGLTTTGRSVAFCCVLLLVCFG